MDLENTILKAIQAVRQRAYAIRLRTHENIEYGRISLIETDYTRQNTCTSTFENLVQLPLFEAWPVFADSLLSTEVAVSNPCESIAQDSALEKRSHGIDELDYQCSSALYYKLYQPIPGYLGKKLYRSGMHVVALLSRDTGFEITTSSIAHNLLTQLTGNINKISSSRDVVLSLFLESDGSKGGRLKNRQIANIQTECYQLANVCHRLNLIGKADLLFCDSSGVAVDAIRASVPTVFIKCIPSGFEKLQQCVIDYLVHGNRQQLISAQIKALDEILIEQSQRCHVMSHQKSLHSLIYRRIDEVDKLHARYEATPLSKQAILKNGIGRNGIATTQQDLILHTQQSLCVEPEKLVKLKNSFESSRRKFQKFRESPVRFMEDSHSRFLRSLATVKS